MTLALVQRFDSIAGSSDLNDVRDKVLKLVERLAGDVLGSFETGHFTLLREADCFVTKSQLAIMISILEKLVAFEDGTLFALRENALQNKTILRKIKESSEDEVANDYTLDEVVLAQSRSHAEWDTAARVAEESIKDVELVLPVLRTLESEFRIGELALRGGQAFLAVLTISHLHPVK